MQIIRLPLNHPLTRFALAGSLIVSLAGCAPNLAGTNAGTGTDTQTDGNQNQTEKPRVVTTSSNGVFTTVLDADVAKANQFTYFSFETGKEVKTSTPETSKEWDLAFKSTTILANSGVSGAGKVSVKRHTETSFDALSTADSSGYVRDKADGDDEGTALDNGFLLGDAWYSYNGSTHVVTPRDHVYTVRANSGKFYKMQVTKYYDDAGTARYVTFKWAELASPFVTKADPENADVKITTVDADSMSDNAWTYYSFSSGSEVKPATPATSTDWDIAFKGLSIATNGGTSGTGNHEVVRLAGQDFDTLTQAPASGYSADAATTAFDSGDDWNSYNFATHVVSIKDAVYVVKTGSNTYFKVKVLSYYDAAETGRIITFKWAEIAAPAAL